MQKKIVSLAAPILIGIMALALGWFAHAAVPLSAQAIVVDGHATRSDPAAPPPPPPGGKANLTYQGRLTNSSGTPINTAVNVVFKLYDSSSVLLWTSATRSMTPSNGLFTVYLGDGLDPDLLWGTLAQAAKIGVTVGGDLSEMTPRQALNSVVGHSPNEVGVVGSSNTGYGVYGSSNTNYGVSGSSNSGNGVNGSSNTGFGVFGSSQSSLGVWGSSESSDGVVGASGTGYGVNGHSNSGEGVVGRSISGDGVVGQTSDVTRAGVLARGADNSGIALEIASGGIKATGAGITTSTFAFIHVSSADNFSNNSTIIDNALTNEDPTAMLFVTHVYNPAGVADNYFNIAFGVDYNSYYHRWAIYREDNGSMPSGISFNVMVIKR